MSRRRRQQATGRVARTLDLVIGVLSPRWAYQRHVAREAMAAHDGPWAGGRRELDGEAWITSDGSADEDLLPRLPELRQRSRELVQNDPHANAIIRAYVDQVVGKGIRPKSTPDRLTLAEAGISEDAIDAFARKADAVWQRWVPHSDATGRIDHYEQQRMIEQRVSEDGDVFAVPAMLSDREKLAYRPFELAVEIVEADRVRTPVSAKGEDARLIRAGVQLERGTGRPLRVHIAVEHPGDRAYGDAARSETFRSLRFRDSDGRPRVLHVMHPTRPGQTRGAPVLSCVLPLFKLAKDTIRAEAISIKVQALFSAFIKREDPQGFTRAVSTQKTDGDREMRMLPGGIFALRPGEDVEFGNPTRPGNSFDQWIQRMLQILAAGTGLSYEDLTGDFSRTTYTSGRMSTLRTRRMFLCRREKIVSAFSAPIRRMLLEEAVLKGDLEAPQFDALADAWCAAVWQGDPWPWVDPQKEAAAAKIAIEEDLRSRRDIVLEQGRDPDDVYRDRARDAVAKAEIIGDLEPRPPVAPPVAPDVQPGGDEEASQDDDPPDEDELDGEQVEEEAEQMAGVGR